MTLQRESLAPRGRVPQFGGLVAADTGDRAAIGRERDPRNRPGMTIGFNRSLARLGVPDFVEAIVSALEKAQQQFYNTKSLKNKDLVNRVFEIHYKYIRVIFQLKNTFIEVSNILNIHAFPPNGTPVYEAF